MRDTYRTVTQYLVLALAAGTAATIFAATSLAAASPATASPAAVRVHDPHVHGVSRINVAVEGRSAVVELFIPAASVYGFEHEPRDQEEEKAREQALKRLEENIARVLIFDQKAGCRPKSVKVDLSPRHGSKEKGDGHDGHEHDHHAEVFSEFTLDCDVDLAGRKVRIGVFGLFPSIHQATVVVLSETTQQRVRVRDAETTVTL